MGVQITKGRSDRGLLLMTELWRYDEDFGPQIRNLGNGRLEVTDRYGKHQATEGVPALDA